MNNTPFTQMHIEAGAKMLPFAGYNMPIEYSGIKDEHMTVRNGVGVFDVSHMGEIWVKGKNALDFVQYVTSNDASKLIPGQAQYSCFPNGKGGIIDDLLVYYYEKDKYLLVVNASNTEKDYNWLVANNKFNVEIENASQNIAQLAIQGPKATAVMQKLTDADLKSIPYYHFKTGRFAGVDNVIISATGYTGAGGFEIYFYNEYASQIWDAIFEAGREFDIKPIGLGARDTLRLEMGFCLYGNDIDDSTSPLEAGLGWITKFTSEKDFIDKGILFNQKEQGLKRRLRGFKMIDKGIPRHEYEIADADGNIIGKVTSGSISPVLGVGIGLGYIKYENSEIGNEIFISIRGKLLKAEIVKLPFI